MKFLNFGLLCCNYLYGIIARQKRYLRVVEDDGTLPVDVDEDVLPDGAMNSDVTGSDDDVDDESDEDDEEVLVLLIFRKDIKYLNEHSLCLFVDSKIMS